MRDERKSLFWSPLFAILAVARARPSTSLPLGHACVLPSWCQRNAKNKKGSRAVRPVPLSESTAACTASWLVGSGYAVACRVCALGISRSVLCALHGPAW